MRPRQVEPLPASALRKAADQALDFETTAELEPLEGVVGQERALEALEFGVGLHREGFNIFALGPPGVGKHSVVERAISARAAREPVPDDWCYVNSFHDRKGPRALRLPAGRGRDLKGDMRRLVEELKTAIPAAFESDEYRARVRELEAELEERHEALLAELREEAEGLDLTLVRTPSGFAFAPIREGRALSPEEFSKLAPDEQRRATAAMETLDKRVQETLAVVPTLRADNRKKLKALGEEVAIFEVGHLIDAIRDDYRELPQVQAYLDAVREDVVDHAAAFREAASEAEVPPAMAAARGKVMEALARRYEVNLIVDNSSNGGAPVIHEDLPTLANLVGRVEHRSEMGALVTDFTLIKPGALHRANGGFLVLDARRVLGEPMVWDGLKRALRAKRVKIESVPQRMALVSTVSLDPQPIPLDVTVVLVGEPLLYYLLCQHDPEFQRYFKVAADFDDRVERSDASSLLYARYIAARIAAHALMPFERGAVARVLEHLARKSGDSERFSANLLNLGDVLDESDHVARLEGAERVGRAHVEAALEMRRRRLGRPRERVMEAIANGTIRVETEGAVVGQINGLAVLALGEQAFGRPSRITATARLGKGEVVDIEREAKLGGKLHSKGVLILSSFLAHRFAVDAPLSLSASLVFEQSYGGIDGDSASLAELVVLMSAIGGVPIRQGLALTGSVDQLGRVQAIGGVNEKIEGFFEVCAARGLDGSQGVLIPASNTRHLMLREEVVQAVEEGRFHVWAVETVDQALTLLTGSPAGEADAEGSYPPESVNGRVAARLKALLERRTALARESSGAGAEDDGEG